LLLVASNFHTPLKELAAVYYIIFLAIYLDCVSVDIRNRGREETDGEKGWSEELGIDAGRAITCVKPVSWQKKWSVMTLSV
jgi:hypothetical protein